MICWYDWTQLKIINGFISHGTLNCDLKSILIMTYVHEYLSMYISIEIITTFLSVD